MPFIKLVVKSRATPKPERTVLDHVRDAVSKHHCQDAPYAHWRWCLSDLCVARRYVWSADGVGPCDACRAVGALTFVVTGVPGTESEGERAAWCAKCAQVPLPF